MTTVHTAEYAPLQFSIPFTIFPLLFSLPPGRSSDRGSRSRLFAPLPFTVLASQFYREKISAISSLVDSRRIAVWNLEKKN